MSSGAAHLLLSATSTVTLASAPDGPGSGILRYGTFVNILLYGIVGFLRHAIPDLRNNLPIIRLLAIVKLIARNLALPCVVTYLYLLTGHSAEVAYAHAFSGVVPVALFLLKLCPPPLTDVVLAGNILSLMWVSYSVGNMWGLGLGMCHFINHFFLDQIRDNINAPVDCLYVIGMSFFNMFALKAVKYN